VSFPISSAVACALFLNESSASAVVLREDGKNRGPSTYPRSHRGGIAPIPVPSCALGHLPPMRRFWSYCPRRKKYKTSTKHIPEKKVNPRPQPLPLKSSLWRFVLDFPIPARCHSNNRKTGTMVVAWAGPTKLRVVLHQTPHTPEGR
jgi:hypothetical protein